VPALIEALVNQDAHVALRAHDCLTAVSRGDLAVKEKVEERLKEESQRVKAQWTILGRVGSTDAYADFPGNAQVPWLVDSILLPYHFEWSYSPTPVTVEVDQEQFLDLLSRLPVTDDFHGRTSLLDGIPGTDRLHRDESMKRKDLRMVLTQLERLGALADGSKPVVWLIGNALSYAEGYQIEEELKRIQRYYRREASP
jgi:hypothetical protein